MAASPRQWVMIVAAIAVISLMIHMGVYTNGHNGHGFRHWFGGNETVPHWATQLSHTVTRVSVDIATLDEKLGALTADVRSADHRSSNFNKLINSTLKRSSSYHDETVAAIVAKQEELAKQVTEMKTRLESLSKLDSISNKDNAIEADVKNLINTLNSVSSSLAAHIQESNSRHAAVTDNINKLLSSLTDLQFALSSAPGAPKPHPLHHWKPGDKETHADKVAVIIESRPIHRLIRVVKQFMSGMKDDWEFQIWFSNLNEKMLRDSPDIQAMMRAGRLRMYPMGRDVFDIPWYNRLMMSNVTFWEFVGGKHVLIFQVDATLCTKSPKKIEDFLEYNYCGAPWASPWYGDAGGNGGLSLRGREATLKCVRGFHGYGANEDGYFTECIARQEERGEGKICRREVAKTFSVETVYYETPWGVHNAYTYLKPEETAALMQYCPELADARKPLQLEPN